MTSLDLNPCDCSSHHPLNSGPGSPWGSRWSGPPQEDVGEALAPLPELPHSNCSPWTFAAETIQRTRCHPADNHPLRRLDIPNLERQQEPGLGVGRQPQTWAYSSPSPQSSPGPSTSRAEPRTTQRCCWRRPQQGCWWEPEAPCSLSMPTT